MSGRALLRRQRPMNNYCRATPSCLCPSPPYRGHSGRFLFFVPTLTIDSELKAGITSAGEQKQRYSSLAVLQSHHMACRHDHEEAGGGGGGDGHDHSHGHSHDHSHDPEDPDGMSLYGLIDTTRCGIVSESPMMRTASCWVEFLVAEPRGRCTERRSSETG